MIRHKIQKILRGIEASNFFRSFLIVSCMRLIFFESAERTVNKKSSLSKVSCFFGTFSNLLIENLQSFQYPYQQVAVKFLIEIIQR